MKFFSRFKRKQPSLQGLEKETDEVAEGQVWALKGKGPWPREGRSFFVTVRDVKDGWVRFRIGEGSVFNDERLEEETFRFCYQRVQ